MKDFEPGTSFRPVLDDPLSNHDTAKRVVLVSGKLYYDLTKERATRQLNNQVALVRLEELSPFPFEQLQGVLSQYSSTNEVLFVQEEPRNQGSWGHVGGRIDTVLRELGREAVVYRGRKESALPAPGIGKMYQTQQQAVIQSTFEGL